MSIGAPVEVGWSRFGLDVLRVCRRDRDCGSVNGDRAADAASPELPSLSRITAR